MKIWFPNYYTEAHRDVQRKSDLIYSLLGLGIHCYEKLTPECELAFCGSIYCFEEVKISGTELPVLHYNWDMYPWMVENDPNSNWKSYIGELKTCGRILVPNSGTAIRTKEYTGRDSAIVKSPVKVWEPPPFRKEFKSLPKPGSYVLDVMRDYPWDPNRNLSDRICKTLGIPLVKSATTLSWDSFRYQVANAAVLLSCCQEASTGGLTLLEGYAHGVPCLLSDSESNGAGEYFGDRATYFDWKSDKDAEEKLWELWLNHSNKGPEFYRSRGEERGNREWVETEYSDRRFAADLKKEFEKCQESKSEIG